MKLNNPFVTYGYVGPEYFCDREKETTTLISALENERNVTLIAPRRYGKTGLIKNAFARMPSEYATIYLDIYSITNLSGFVETLAKAVVNGSRASLDSVFKYLEEKSRTQRVVIAIDEFQQVRSFPEQGVEALLRSYIQFLPFVKFIFAGSQRHMMMDMFVSPKGPFYQSTQILELDVIPEPIYADFASRFFKGAGRGFDREAFTNIYRHFDGITWYVQAALSKIWELERDLAGTDQLDRMIRVLWGESESTYQTLFFSQNDASQELLLAIAKAGLVPAPMAAEFLSTYHLRGASTVSAALKDLLTRDLVYRTDKGYVVYDRLFAEYLKARN